MQRTASGIVSATFLGLVVACGGGNGGGTGAPLTAGVGISPSHAQLKPGGAQALAVYDASGVRQPSADVTWTSSAPNTVQVSRDGLAVATGTGTAVVTAGVHGARDTATIEVGTSANRPVEVVNVLPPEGVSLDLSGTSPCQLSYPPICRRTSSIPMIPLGGAEFIFLGDDTYASATISLDGVNMTARAVPTPLTPGAEGAIFLDLLANPPTAGEHALRVVATSQAGKSVTYEWSFTVVGDVTGFQTVDQGVISGVTQERLGAIRDQETWKAFWTQHKSIDASERARTDVPPIDFDRYALIIVHLGPRPSGGYGVAVTRVARTESVLAVHYEETVPAAGCVVTQATTQPYHLIQVAKTVLEPSFSREAVSRCESQPPPSSR